MLYNGEHIGDGSPPEVDIAVDPLEGTTLTREGLAERACRDRAVRARHDVRPGPVRLHGEDGRRRRHRATCSTSSGRSATRSGCRQAKGTDVSDLTVIMLDRARHEEAVKEIREAGARIRFITDGDVSAALLAVTEGTRRRPAVGHRRHARGRPPAARDQVHGRPDASAACGRATTTSAGARIDAGYDLEESSTRPPGVGRRRVLRRHRRHRRRHARRAFATATARRDHRVAGDALALRHRAHGRRHAQPREAPRAHRRAVRLDFAR